MNQELRKDNERFFILGRVPELSVREIEAVITADYPAARIDERGSEATIVSSDLPVSALVERLGGSIKGGRVLAASIKNLDAVAEHIAHDIKSRAQQADRRITFGISAYSVSRKPLKGNAARRVHIWTKKTGLAIKKEMRTGGASVRFVAPQRTEAALSSVVVAKNHLTREPNVEYVVLIGEGAMLLGVTEAIQDFEAYSYRDYHRPHRDMKTGMLPPKLARAMVNLAGIKSDATLLDPFCGLGTVLQEALLLGYQNVLGSDIAENNVRASRENIEWLKQWGRAHFPKEFVPAPIFSSERDPVNCGHVGISRSARNDVRHCDARNLTACFQKNSIDAIVTEPPLGRAMTQGSAMVSRTEIASLCDLYIASFQAFREVLKPEGRVVIVFPVWLTEGSEIHIPCIEDIEKSGFKNIVLGLDPALRRDDKEGSRDDKEGSRDDKEGSRDDKSANERGILIAREDSRVARELFVFQKI